VHSGLVGFPELEFPEVGGGVCWVVGPPLNSDRVVCEANVVHSGSRIATAEGRVFVEGTGKLIAHGSTTCIVLSPNGARTTKPCIAAATRSP